MLKRNACNIFFSTSIGIDSELQNGAKNARDFRTASGDISAICQTTR